MVEYLNSLRESIFEAYTGIIQGLKSENKERLLLPFLNGVFNFIAVVASDKDRSDSVTRNCIGVIGDLVSALGPDVRDLLRIQNLDSLIADGLKSDEQTTIQVSKWAKDSLTKLAQHH